MSLVACNSTSAGLRGSEVLVTVHDINDRRHAIRVERDFLTSINGKDYLPLASFISIPKPRKRSSSSPTNRRPA